MKNVNSLIFEKIITNKNLIIILIFWSEFCTPCKITKSNLEEIKNIFKKKIKILKLEISCNEYMFEKFTIKSVPTTIMIKNRNIIIKKGGVLEKNYIKNKIKKILEDEKK
ncbi:MAG: thioredoxin domain-containing protein [Candidatus Nasuia deltocephalinicola]